MKKTLITILTGCAITFASCEKVLQTEPKQSISAEGALSTISGVQGLLTNVYDLVQGSGYYGRDLIVQSEVLSDNMRIAVSNSNRFVNESSNVVRSHFDDYAISYQIINKTNLVIDNIDKTSDGSAAEKARIKGEALFIRALVYFNLVNEYGYNPKFVQGGFDLGVPIVLTGVSSASQVTSPARAKVAEVYTQVKKDLTDAIPLLGNTSKILPSKAAAQGLLSRVALYNQDWQLAVDNATLAINSGLATFVTTPTVAGYQSIFNQKISPESLFELNFEITESLLTNSIQNIYQRLGNSPTSSSGYGDIVPQNNLLAAYETGDVRRTATLTPVVKSGEAINWVQKYPGSGGQYGTDNIRVLRISEVILNRAEANFELGNTTAAQGDLNTIRTRAGLPTVPVTLAAILKERRIELAYEGHRWFDLVRRGQNIVKDNGTVLFTDFRILAPLAIAEMDINKSLVQNPGY